MAKDTCYHCGTECDRERIEFDEKAFCCNGCKTVYEILNQNELSCYYDLEKNPGTIPGEIQGKYDYLDNEEIAKSLLEFDDLNTSVVNFLIPSIHCSSCIWVLENLHKLNKGVKVALVDFPKKEVRITFSSKEISLRELVELIASIGYEPYISLEDAEVSAKKVDRKLIYQVAVAGFAFGNVMMLSFPEYFQMDEFWLNRFKPLFRGLMLLMALPALLYSGKDYLISAYKGLRKGILNIDVPISLGMLVLFFRSAYEIFSNTGQGYFDSLTGLIFFLLLGKVFQQKTYSFLSFERDYKSYFPIAVTKVVAGEKRNIRVHEIERGDRLLIRNQEILPVDGILINGKAMIDYSFVTGESLPVLKVSGDKLFAGGKQQGEAIEIEALETVKQSYLTQLWSNDVFTGNRKSNIKSLTDSISRGFTLIILSIALLAGIYWYRIDPGRAFQVVSAILIVACPCALALSAPFSLGNMIRIFGKNKLYLKNANVIESMAALDSIVFDKTGTITANNNTRAHYEGESLTKEELARVKSLLRSSNHPLSRSLYTQMEDSQEFEVDAFEEILGKGIQGRIEGCFLKLGSSDFVGAKTKEKGKTLIFVKFGDEIKGRFVFENTYREGLDKLLNDLGDNYELSVLTGDNEGERSNLLRIMPDQTELLFRQKPEDKLNYIEKKQGQGRKILMLGDGLNDAGALAQSDVGISVSENINVLDVPSKSRLTVKPERPPVVSRKTPLAGLLSPIRARPVFAT